VQRIASVLDSPFCVAGGIRSVADAEAILNAGAEKISVNSPALADPALIDQLALRFGSQCVVVGMDSQGDANGWRVHQFTGDPDRSGDAGRRTLEDGVRALGRTSVPSHANFLLVEVGDAAKVYASLLRQGVIVRPVANYGLPRHLRVTVGLPAENRRFLDALAVALA
jgi:tRNA-dihydrouridine synthase